MTLKRMRGSVVGVRSSPVAYTVYDDDLTPRPSQTSRVTLARVMEVMDANNLGNVHGGVIMRAVDTTAGTCATRHCGGPAVTAFMDEMAFLEPVRIGDILTTKASVNWTGRTSLEVGVRVEAHRYGEIEPSHVGSAYLVFVAIDDDGNPRRARPIEPIAPEDHRRHREAEIRRESRLARRAAIRDLRGVTPPDAQA
jgi:acyl-CoA hydrolase